MKIMKCQSCGAEAVNATRNRSLRCLKCGQLLISESENHVDNSNLVDLRHSYKTPFGKLIAQMQKTGKFVAVNYISVPDESKSGAATLISTLLTSWRKLNSSSMPSIHSFNSIEMRCTWVYSKTSNLSSLLKTNRNLSINQIKEIILALAAKLDCLHQVGLGAFDLSPSVIFVSPDIKDVFFLPTLWLASQALWSPGQIKHLPFTAPELENTCNIYPDPIRADLYALGALAWFLLTGTDRRQHQTVLPSEISSNLIFWDQFVDGCCRSNPARRFDSLDDALKSLEVRLPIESQKQQSEYIIEFAKNSVYNPKILISNFRFFDKIIFELNAIINRCRPKLSTCVAILLLIILAIGISVRNDGISFAEYLLGKISSPYDRGISDSVIRYSDRSYENSSWIKLKESDSLGKVFTIDDSDSIIPFHSITGYDDKNFWIVLESGRTIQYRDGHWLSRGKPLDASYPVARLIDKDNLLVAGDGMNGGFYHFTPNGIVDYGKNGTCLNRMKGMEITVISNDLFYLYSREWPHLNDIGVLKLAQGKRSEMQQHLFKESLVHRDDNTILKEYPVRGITFTQNISSGKALGIAFQGMSLDQKPIIVSYKNGIWYYVEDLQNLDYPNGKVINAWFGINVDGSRFVVIVGIDGHVQTHQINGPKFLQTINSLQENTSMTLFKVWGCNMNKFWVMDTNGTIWERLNSNWRVVVRGLRRNKVEFRAAWVSPNGIIFALTDKHIYRLD
jgi:serine/threonine protein kinase